tara:strand:+ start:2743 stop:3657 length:915 start_codon:yes stop_codon:yes gene_type:complete
MLPDNFDFALLPVDASKATLKEIGMLSSTIETIDYAMVSWLKEDLKLSAVTNEGNRKVPVLWQTPERSFQIKNAKELRDDDGALKLPVISIQRTAMTKDPNRKGGFQAHLYSKDQNGRAGRIVIAKRIVEDKTRNFAVAGNTRVDPGAVAPKPSLASGKKKQMWFPRKNNKIVIQSLSIPIPVYINIDYKIVMKTEYQQQMNELVAPFIARTGQINSFVLKRDGHLYEAFIEQNFAQSNNVANLGEDTRLFQTEINIKVLGYLIGEGKNDDRPIVRIDENVVEISFPQEMVAPPGDWNFFGNVK